ncbi:TonB-dependent receptor plug domain-containing protein [Ketobacter sp. MCCC 1A13808]|uniref:TonB-dependent receptor domain-containing protein n=1 Tax=Ketobacter sp. MCCC 1A13808 TaxID=2602738 RepID=UPI000F113918|nr:TonB-dependent receptor [Ketobacter sp. MCCC 1A13808]MVF13858.1 TonB-dependent receptor plug domain-containing protein [Ketobacter sp. MCCC 1A13808]RLP54909.1 MAG: Fe-regulated protein B [Ketobacter sp.]
MNKSHVLGPLLVGVTGMSNPLMAQEDAATLDAVQVWGTEVHTSSVDLDDEAIAIRQSDHISDLLRPLPGVDVGGAHSLNQRITIRSMDDKDLNITIDGANQNNYMYHHMGNLQINTNILKSAEIAVGNNSVVNGGLGGAVRFKTKSADELLMPGQQVGAHLKYTFNSNASQSYSATGYGNITDSIDILGYYNLIERDNFEVGGGEIRDFQDNVVPGTDGTVRGLEGELDDALIKLGWDITEGQRLVLGYETYTDEGDYSYRPDMGLSTDLAIAVGLNTPLEFPTEYTRDTLTLNYDVEVGESTFFETTVFQNTSEFWRDESGLSQSTAGFIAASAAITQGEADNTGIKILGKTEIDGTITHGLVYGLDSVKYETNYRSQPLSGGLVESNEEATDSALYIEDKIGFGNGISVTPGVRYSVYDIESTVVTETYDDVTGALALEYEAANGFSARASTTQLFKGPELGEIFVGAGIDDAPNPDIEAETGYNHELFFGFQEAAWSLDQFSMGITFFQTEIDGYIYDYAASQTTGFSGKDNVGDMTNEGYEAYIGFDYRNLSVLWTYARANSELSAFAEYSYLQGARLDREQGNSRSLSVDYFVASRDLNLHWDMQLVNDLPAGADLDGASFDNAKEGYMVHNISLRWTPAQWEGLDLTLGVDNLFDEYYASQSSRTGLSKHPLFGDLFLLDYEPGRNVKVSVGYRF